VAVGGRLGGINTDEYEVYFSDEGTFVPADKELPVTVKAKGNNVCAELKESHFFSRFGQMVNGKLKPNGIPYPIRQSRILNDMLCAFRHSQSDFFTKRDSHDNLYVDCKSVAWVADCVLSVLEQIEE